MSAIFPTIVSLVVAGAAGLFGWDRHRMCKAEIEGSLRKYHARDVKITFDWFDYDRDTFTYDVEYRDREGKVHTNRCKVSPADESIYWVTPIEPPAA